MKIIKYLLTGLKQIPIIFIKGLYYFGYGLLITISIFPRYLIIGIFYMLNPQKAKEIKVHNKPIISILIISLCLTIYLLSVFIFSAYNVQKLRTKYLIDSITKTSLVNNNKNNPLVEEEKQEETPTLEKENTTRYYPSDYYTYRDYTYINVKFDDLKTKNSDTVAWLQINNTYVNYPIVQTTDNMFYLTHDYSKKSNMGGWVYGDYRNNFNNFDQNTVIYGHNLINKTMFGSLPKVLNKTWYDNKDNLVMKLSTPSTNSLWQIFSIYTTPAEAYYATTDFNSDEEYLQFINDMTKRSIYDFGINLDANSKMLTLTTCTDDGKARVVVHAKMVSIKYK